MQEHSVKVNGTHVSVVSLLGAVLVVLKLLGKISISWFWVLSPFWLPWAILFSIMVGLGLIAVLAGIIVKIMEARDAKKRRQFYRKSGF